MTSGIHHITAVTRNVQANVDFWLGFLGLKLVKQTAGFEDAEQLHLFYGDRAAQPGTLVSFLVWQDGAPGRIGHGQVTEIALRVPAAQIGDWLTRALQHQIKVEGPVREFGEPVLRLKDPDGIIVKLVGANLPATEELAPLGLHGATIWSAQPEQTAAFVTRFGYRQSAQEGAVRRLNSDSDVLDIRDATGFVEAIPGTGVIDHVAFRVPDVAAIEAHRAELSQLNSSKVTVHDRKYFTSLYVREPGNSLIELATDGPGMTVDEELSHLGSDLKFPPHFAARSADLRVRLPQFSLPGEERMAMRNLPFVHRIHKPQDHDGSTIVLLHGSGRNETDMMPFASQLAPRALLLGVRGRSLEEGSPRYFRRKTMTSFDQDDIRAEAQAFSAFMTEAVAAYDLDPNRITALGYSNGANFAAAVMGLHPGVLRRAILLRPMAALEVLPQVDLSGSEVLSIQGARDPYGPHAPRLNEWLEEMGADLDARTLTAAGHGIEADDLVAAKAWMSDHKLV